MTENTLPPGWVLTETGAWRRETIHRMDRRCRNWDYCGTGAYMVTMALNDQCAGGNLLILAPAAWPYLPGEKPITRIDACVLNRLAQLVCGDGAAEIRYRGVTPTGVERLVAEAVLSGNKT